MLIIYIPFYSKLNPLDRQSYFSTAFVQFVGFWKSCVKTDHEMRSPGSR